MTEMQQTAIAHHCRFAFETAHPRFLRLLRGGRLSAILTVNSGYE